MNPGHDIIHPRCLAIAVLLEEIFILESLVACFWSDFWVLLSCGRSGIQISDQPEHGHAVGDF